MKPFFLKPACKSSIWGGTKLKSKFGKDFPGEIISESWELSVHPAGLSLADSGENADTPLSDLIRDPLVLGKNPACYPQFPLMIKWIDSQRPLSIQVHPDNEYAMEKEGDMGKTEMWYIIECEPDAYLYYGFEKAITPQEFADRIANDTLLDVVKKVPVKKGDVFFIPSGTLHAIGPGILLAEVQQSSNLTYRIYDYGRLDTDGKPRELHVEKAREVTDLFPAKEAEPTPIPLSHPQDSLLSCCPYFAVVRQLIDEPRTYTADPNSFHALMCVEGEGSLHCSGETVPFPAGATLFVPANSECFSLDGKMTVLDVFVPDTKYF